MYPKKLLKIEIHIYGFVDLSSCCEHMISNYYQKESLPDWGEKFVCFVFVFVVNIMIISYVDHRYFIPTSISWYFMYNT